MKTLILLAAAVLVAGMNCAQAQHGHINAGVVDTDGSGTANAGDKLAFKNASDFAYDFTAHSGFTMNLPGVALGGIAIYYGGAAYHTAWTPTALSGDSGRRIQALGGGNVPVYSGWETFLGTGNGAAGVAGAHMGSYLKMTLVSVELLSGSATRFSIWENYEAALVGEWEFAGVGLGTLETGSATFDLTAGNTRIGPGDGTVFPDVSLPATSMYPGGWSAGALAAGFRWNVSPPGDESGAVDPYGHIHGRNFATDGPGVFRMNWRITDANGVHTDSDLFAMRFQAIPEPSVWLLFVLGAVVAVIAHRRLAASKGGNE
jgi:hypothetical protein